MRNKPKTSRLGSAARLAIAGFCAASYLALAIGFPLPEGTGQQPDSEPFPCQHHACGCRSADHCWRSCCCMTMQEKLAWARNHGVSPPDFVVAGAKQEEASPRADACCDSAVEPQRTCCKAAHRPDTAIGPRVRNCCSSERRSDEIADLHSDDLPRDRSERSNWVLGVHAQKCQGLATFWVTVGAVLGPPELIQLPAGFAQSAWCRFSWVCFWQTVSQRPDVPPPRCA